MSQGLCSKSMDSNQLAVGLSFASATLLSLEATHANHCLWMGITADQSFALSAYLATLSVFLGSYILARIVKQQSLPPQ